MCLLKENENENYVIRISHVFIYKFNSENENQIDGPLHPFGNH